MNFKDYDRLVDQTAYKGRAGTELLDECTCGLSSESGEVIDVFKKFKWQDHPLDKEHLIEELGDCLWYICGCAHALGVSIEDVAVKNKEKLARRYPDGFSPSKSINR